MSTKDKIRIEVNEQHTLLADGASHNVICPSGVWHSLQDQSRETPIVPPSVRLLHSPTPDTLVAVVELPAGIKDVLIYANQAHLYERDPKKGTPVLKDTAKTSGISKNRRVDDYGYPETVRLAMPYVVLIVPFLLKPQPMILEGFITCFYRNEPLKSLDDSLSYALMGGVFGEVYQPPCYICLGHNFWDMYPHTNPHLYISKMVGFIIQRFYQTPFNTGVVYNSYASRMNLTVYEWAKRTEKENDPSFILKTPWPALNNPKLRFHVEYFMNGRAAHEANYNAWYNFQQRAILGQSLKITHQDILKAGRHYINNRKSCEKVKTH